MLLTVSDVHFSYGANEVLKGAELSVRENDRVGLVGYNGCGKTTLFNIITGALAPSAGNVSLKPRATMGYLAQTSGLNDANTVLQEMQAVGGADAILARMKQLEKSMGDDLSLIEEYEQLVLRYEAIDGYNHNYYIKKVLGGMGFPAETHDKSVSVLSGGERTRLALAKLLVLNPDLLVLDEPTNHLDLDTLEWLEGFLKSYSGAVLAVSHDRWFLDETMTGIVELLDGETISYSGNYTAFLAQREQRLKKQRAEYQRAKQENERLLDYAQRNIVRASTSKMAKSRLKMAARLDLAPPQNAEHEAVKFKLEPAREPYKDVLTVEGLGVSIGGRQLIQGLDLVLERGDRLAITGPNGAGKTTLLRVIIGELRPSAGRVLIGGGVQWSYFSQNLFRVESKTPFDYIRDRYPRLTQLEIRNLLASVGFRGEDVFTESRGLSGGELARLYLARISLERPNFLILDEPTNHLDLYTKDILQQALEGYEGTLLTVSHDRYFISGLGCGVLNVAGDGTTQRYKNYTALRAAGRDAPAAEQPAQKQEPAAPKPKVNQKDLRAWRAKQREQKRVLELRIEQLEQELKKLEGEAALPEIASDHERLSELFFRIDQIKTELPALSDEWLALEIEEEADD